MSEHSKDQKMEDELEGEENVHSFRTLSKYDAINGKLYLYRRVKSDVTDIDWNGKN